MKVIIEVSEGLVQNVYNAEEYEVIDFDIIGNGYYGYCPLCLEELLTYGKCDYCDFNEETFDIKEYAKQVANE